MNVLIVGANGAIGGICASVCKNVLGVDNVFTPRSSEVYIGSLDSRLYLDFLPKVDIVVLAFGTYGGLKSYEYNFSPSYGTSLLSDLTSLLCHPSCVAAQVILYSSAVLENKKNSLLSSPYYHYAHEKHAIEEVVRNNSFSSVIFRPTNILSRFENYHSSGHAVASIYRNIRDHSKAGFCEIWSNPLDWREFTTEQLISDTLRYAITCKLELSNYILAFGSGYKMFMSELVHEIASVFDQDSAYITFSQPQKNGPLLKLVSMNHVSFGYGFNVDVVSELKRVIETWKEIDEDERRI